MIGWEDLIYLFWVETMTQEVCVASTGWKTKEKVFASTVLQRHNLLTLWF